MKLTEQQLSAIQQKLTCTVKYKETYDELYDHVISTIENLDGEYTDTTIDEVIEHDFGSYDNLNNIERSSTKLAGKAMQKKHWQNITYFLNWPAVLFTIALIIAGYYICINPANRKTLIGFTILCAILPISYLLLTKLYAKYRAWYFNDYRKASIKDGYIYNAAILSNSVINILMFAINKTILLAGPISLLVFVMYTIYVLSFFKLYRQTYKVNIASN